MEKQDITSNSFNIFKTVTSLVATLLFLTLGTQNIKAQETVRDMFAHPEKYLEDINNLFNHYSNGDSLLFSEGSVLIKNDKYGKRFILISKDGKNFLPLTYDNESIRFAYAASKDYATERESFESTINELLNTTRAKTQPEKEMNLQKNLTNLQKEINEINKKYGTAIKVTMDSTQSTVQTAPKNSENQTTNHTHTTHSYRPPKRQKDRLTKSFIFDVK